MVNALILNDVLFRVNRAFMPVRAREGAGTGGLQRSLRLDDDVLQAGSTLALQSLLRWSGPDHSATGRTL
jgi:hypothetical protein